MNLNNKSPNLNRKIILNLIVLFSVVAVLLPTLTLVSRVQEQLKPKNTYADMITELRNGRVSELEVSENKREIVAKIYKNDDKNRSDVEVRIYPNIVDPTKNKTTLEYLNESLGDKKLEIGSDSGKVIYTEKSKSFWIEVVENIFSLNTLLLVLLIGATAVMMRRIAEANNRTISFGLSRAKAYNEMENREKITFKDVAGNEEAKEELTEVVDFLKRPEEYIKMGAKIPKGVLLVGSPGNGKTLMAKAIAGEANVPFLFVSGSEFVEMFVGVGAGRVRDLFNRAKKKAPCVIFIDEIDAVGRRRGTGMTGGNDEREQTLNQILVEMDGFESTTSVIVIGATNRPDVLDPALLRPGRFDRQVTVTAPDRKERLQILKVHSKNKKLADNVDLEIVAKRTAGFSGADLMNVLNEAAILTVRAKRSEIDNDTLREAIEKVMLGPSLKSKVMTEEQKRLTAYHEAGHALVSTVLPKGGLVQKVTIIPRGRAVGYAFSTSDDSDTLTRTKSQFLADITVLFGGYTAEEIIFGEVSNGASNDLARATEIARDMVTKYGMSSLGPISFSEERGLSFVGKDAVDMKNFSDESARLIDKEVSLIMKQCHQECREIINKYRQELDQIANTLIAQEVLEYEEFNALVDHIIPASKKQKLAKTQTSVSDDSAKKETNQDKNPAVRTAFPKTLLT